MVDANRTFVIVGGGLPGRKPPRPCARRGSRAESSSIGDERDHPYERPPLSKGYLTAPTERDSVFVHEPAWYAQPEIELHLGQPAVQLDRGTKAVTSATAPRALRQAAARHRRRARAAWTSPAPTSPESTICARLAHADRLRGVLATLGRDNGHLVIAGGGWIGLEVAAAARGYGAEVTVVEPEPTPLHARPRPRARAALHATCTASTASASTSAPGSPRSPARTAWCSRPVPTTGRSTRRTRCSPRSAPRPDGPRRVRGPGAGRPGARRRYRRRRLAAHLRPGHLRRR